MAEITTMTLDCLEARFVHDIPITQPRRGISFQVLCWTVKVMDRLIVTVVQAVISYSH